MCVNRINKSQTSEFVNITQDDEKSHKLSLYSFICVCFFSMRDKWESNKNYVSVFFFLNTFRKATAAQFYVLCFIRVFMSEVIKKICVRAAKDEHMLGFSQGFGVEELVSAVWD